MATERIDVVFTERGSRTVRRGIDDIGGSAQRSQGAVQLLRRALGLIGAGVALRQLQRTVDSFTNIQNRLRNVATSTEQVAVVMDRLFGVANRTRQSFEATAEVYARTALALKDVGASQEEVLQFTESLNQAVILSGASAAEANAALIQLSQGLASGTLRGDELRSVLEQLPAVADVIAKGLGVTRGELRKLGEDGKITAQDILRAFALARGELNDKFGRTVPTIGQAVTILGNQFTKFIGELDKTTGISARVAGAIILLANNMATLGRVAATVGITLGTIFAVRGVQAATRAMIALNAVILANPFVALAVVITGAIAALIAFSDQITLTSDGVVTLRDFAQASFEAIVTFIEPIVVAVRERLGSALDTATKLLDRFGVSWDALLGIARRVVNALIALIVGYARAFSALIRGIVEFIKDPFSGDALDRIKGVGSDVKDAFVSGFGEDFVGQIAAVVDPAFQGVLGRAREIAGQRRAGQQQSAAARAAAAAGLGQRGTDVSGAARERDFAARLKLISDETELLRLNNREREVQTAVLQFQEKFGKTLTESERIRLEATLRLGQSLRDQADALEDIKGPQQDYETRLRAINELLKQGKISQDEANRSLRDARIAVLEQSTDFSSGVERGFLRAQRDIEDFATTAETMISDAFTNAQEVMVNFFKTGKFEISDFVKTIADQLLRLGVQQGFAAVFGQSGPLGGLTAGLGGQGGSGAFGAGGIGGLLTNFASGLFGAANGADFEVNSSNSVGRLSGIDNRLIAFRARDGENVTVTPPGRQPGGRVVNQTFNVMVPDRDSARMTGTQLKNTASAGLSSADRRR